MTASVEPMNDAEAVVRRGHEIYENLLREQLEVAFHGQYLAIETETGEYEVVPTRELLTKRLTEKEPSASRFLMRIGYLGMVQKGGGAYRAARQRAR